jgi:hypothetical protein
MEGEGQLFPFPYCPSKRIDAILASFLTTPIVLWCGHLLEVILGKM